MEGLKMIPYIALTIAIAGIILGASAVVLSKFGDTVDTCYNSSYTVRASGDACENSTTDVTSSSGKGDLNFSNQYYTIYQSLQAEGDIAEQLPTVAIIGVMVVIISIIAGVFVYMRYFN